MDTIINFLEQYWGYTLFGGVSLGAIVTFTVTQIKVILKEKVKSKDLDTALNTIKELYETLDARSNESAEATKQVNDKNNKVIAQLAQQQQYADQVQAATFQAISYLVIASKLPTEDKIALQAKFNNLLKDKTVEYTNLIKEEVAEEVVPDIVETVKESVEETKSLLDKYTKEV